MTTKKILTPNEELLNRYDGKVFATILADPPWQFQNRTGKVAPEHKRLSRYTTMRLEDIMALPVAQLAEDTAHLYLWVPNAFLPEGLRVMEAWGFHYKSNIVWHKVRKDGGSDGRGVGFYFRNVTELVLFGVRGKNARTLAPGRRQVNFLATQKREHSLFVVRMIRQHLQFLETQWADLEQQLFDALKPYEAALDLLLTIPGIDRLVAAKRVVEIGVDMAAFGHAGRLAKWAGICPGNHESAGQRRTGRTIPGNRYVRAVLCEIAWAAIRTTRQFKSRYQGLVIRRGTKKAIIAIAHKVLKTVFVVLSRRVPYQDSTVDYEALSVQRNAPRWIRQLKKYGYLPKVA